MNVLDIASSVDFILLELINTMSLTLFCTSPRMPLVSISSLLFLAKILLPRLMILFSHLSSVPMLTSHSLMERLNLLLMPSHRVEALMQ